VTAEQIEEFAKVLEELASDRRRFVGKKDFDPEPHSDAADAYEHAATLLRKTAKL
jgi:hypothetical protein